MLLEDRPDSAITQNYVREMYQTVRCDHLHNLEPLRSSFEAHLQQEPGKEGAIHRIREYKAVGNDEERALQTLVHYWTWHRSTYRAALPLSSQFYYYTWYKAEKMFAMIGVGSSALYAARNTNALRGIIHATKDRFQKTGTRNFLKISLSILILSGINQASKSSVPKPVSKETPKTSTPKKPEE